MRANLELPLTEKHIAAIGFLIARVSMLESVLDLLLAHYLKVGHDTALGVTTHMSAKDKTETLKYWADEAGPIDDEDKETLLDLLCAAQEANSHRNHVAHAVWIFGKDEQPIAMRIPFGAFNPKKEPFPESKAEEWAEQAKTAMNGLMGFYQHVRDKAYFSPRPEI